LREQERKPESQKCWSAISGALAKAVHVKARAKIVVLLNRRQIGFSVPRGTA
jgi:hypothetical protein